MRLTNGHPHKSYVICIHDVDVKVIYSRQARISSKEMGEDITYNSLVDNG